MQIGKKYIKLLSVSSMVLMGLTSVASAAFPQVTKDSQCVNGSSNFGNTPYYDEVIQGDYITNGVSLMQAAGAKKNPDWNNFTPTNAQDVDSNGSTKNSGYIGFPSIDYSKMKIKKAYITWYGSMYNRNHAGQPSIRQVKIGTDGKNYQTINADTNAVDKIPSLALQYGYRSITDITNFVQSKKPKKIWVADISWRDYHKNRAVKNNIVGAYITIVWEVKTPTTLLKGQKVKGKRVTIYNGLVPVTTKIDNSQCIDWFSQTLDINRGKDDADATMTAIGLEGEYNVSSTVNNSKPVDFIYMESNGQGEYIKNDCIGTNRYNASLADNFQSKICSTENQRSPNSQPSYGLDLSTYKLSNDITNRGNTVTFSSKTNEDQVYLTEFIFSRRDIIKDEIFDPSVKKTFPLTETKQVARNNCPAGKKAKGTVTITRTVTGEGSASDPDEEAATEEALALAEEDAITKMAAEWKKASVQQEANEKGECEDIIKTATATKSDSREYTRTNCLEGQTPGKYTVKHSETATGKDKDQKVAQKKADDAVQYLKAMTTCFGKG